MAVNNLDRPQRQDLSTKVPAYDRKQLIGSGSFGTVYKVKYNGRDVALKEVPLQGDEHKRSFEVEVERLSCLNHQNIIEFIGYHKSDDFGIMIIEYAPGGSLSRLLHQQKERSYDLRHATSWALQVAQAVAYLHSQPKPLIHRDLKPANLLLFSNGKTIKICDFGIACEQKTSMTNDTGTAAYMAPEVFMYGGNNKPRTYTGLCDVYSWSIVFWEILTRRKPYQNLPNATNNYALLFKLSKGLRPDAIEDCPELIWNLIIKSWDREPDNRPSMSEIVEQMKFINSMADPKAYCKQEGANPKDARKNQDHRQQLDEPKFVDLVTKCKALKTRRRASKLCLKSTLHPPECDSFEESRRLKNEVKNLKDKQDVLYSLCKSNSSLK